MSNYGKMDILWLDGGQVRPLSSIDKTVDWQKSIPYDQDIDMANIAKMARSHQPGLLVVDRTVTGKYENYVTPEQQVPETPLDNPWESCLTMGNSWSYVPHDHYKSTHELVQLLIKIVSRGGNLLLNIGPSPEGDWDDTAYVRLKEIGNWMKINQEGIYNTKPIAPYSFNNIYLTKSTNKNIAYAFYMSDKKEVTLPNQVIIEGYLANPKAIINLLGFKDKLTWKQDGNKLVINIPTKLQNKVIGNDAVTFKISN
jgi:alpha-L-fucosidase